MFDLKISGGLVVDGTGTSGQIMDLGIVGDRIIAMGNLLEAATEEIDARGRVVIPGFVDIHTHYDGQATWDQEMAPSSWHGVTTVVMGNCGVGFAPAAPDRREWLVGLMEGVEDIPGSALTEGMTWNWESFPEYLDALEGLDRTVDVAAQVPHGAVRAYVMGDRGAANQEPTETEIARMSAIVEEGLAAGAVGFSTSRTILHKSIDGELVPGTTATKEELLGIGRALKRAGHGVFEMASDLLPEWNEFEWMGDLSRETGAPVTFTALESPIKSLPFKDQLGEMRDQNAKGGNIVAQISMRGTGLILGWRATFHPFSQRPSWKAIADKPWQEQWQQLQDAEFRAKLLAERGEPTGSDLQLIADLMESAFSMQYEMLPGFNYEPTADQTIEQRAQVAGVTPEEYVYDFMMREGGSGLIYFPLLNYANGNLDFLEEALDSDDCINSLSDGGAHCGTICDAAATTFMLQHWVRDRDGNRMTLAQAIKRQCHDTARLYGFEDRGVLAPGLLADLNVIDLESLQLNLPTVAFDLPAGGRRLLQTASGYDYTIKSGQVTFRSGVSTGKYPGRVIRGPQLAPEASSLPATATDSR
ncbi:MAG: amidohydrolase family protein [Luminiphilus sp.]|jgi:N-acyl-D-aspartate/D-glutamate deacylase|nr:amidohydrolase family protein [Luminiphilus sp.]